MSRRTRMSFHLDGEQIARLRAVADRHRVPQAVIVREGIDLACDLWERQGPERMEAGGSRLMGEAGG